MNKKLATLLFGISMGISAGSALAFSPGEPYPCEYYCREAFVACNNSGIDQLQCAMDQIDCWARCGI